jgi:FkbH-like protein
MGTGRRDRLPETALNNLGSLLAAIREAMSVDADWVADASLHFLRNYTTEPIDPYLQYHLIRDDIRPTISHGGYDTMTQELLDPGSDLSRDEPDIIVMSLLVEFLDSRCTKADWTADDCIAKIDELVGHVLQRTSSLLVVNTLLRPIDHLLDRCESLSLGAEIDRVNEQILELQATHSSRVSISDFEDLYSKSGEEHSLDARFWRTSQSPFKKAFLDEYAKDIAYRVRVLKGRARKCLVLDCDNTLWGGVIGEDGIGGIQLHDSDVPGVYFRAFQKAVIALHDQGVMLTICSKNNEDDVWDVFDNHQHCVLKKSHFVAWRINWENKAANIASLADELNVGLDSFVFIDDSPHERSLVEAALPDVLVLDVPGDVASYAGMITSERLFDTTSRSVEDRHRTQMYQQESQRKKEQGSYDDLTDYLKSLGTVMRILPVSEDHKARVAQLTQKTNQFNLTTRRYSEADIERFLADDNVAVHAMSVEDRYGSMGLTGVLIARRHASDVTIDTLLLSCRVLGRQLEFAFVDQCLRLLENRWGKVRWHASYLPTKKNSQVADFWDRAGFTLDSVEDGNRHYLLSFIAGTADYLDIISVELE